MTSEESHRPEPHTARHQAPRSRTPFAAIGTIIVVGLWVMFQGGKILDVFDEMFPRNQASYAWPDLTAEEARVAREIMSKATSHPLTEAEIERYKGLLKAYCIRTKVAASTLKIQPEIGITALELRCRYEHEYASCLLTSFDTKKPFVSEELERLTILCQENACSGFTRRALLADLASLESAVNGTVRTDEDGESIDPITRDEIREYMEWARFCNDNVPKLKEATEEVVASMNK